LSPAVSINQSINITKSTSLLPHVAKKGSVHKLMTQRLHVVFTSGLSQLFQKQ